MFAPNQSASTRELMRVCKPGGKIDMANWTPEGFIGQVFKTIGKYVSPPGYSQVRYNVTIESTAPDNTILAMLNEAEKHSPWLEVFTRPVNCQRHICITAEND